jgi:hypothetical protein
MVLAAALMVLTAMPARADDDCDTAVDNVDDAVQVASKILEAEMAEVTKTKPANDSERAEMRGKFCSATGEFLGISRAYRSVMADCTTGAKRRNSLAQLDESIRSLQKSIKDTCE